MIAPVPDTYLEDASGYRGEAQRLFLPRDEAELSAALREASDGRTPVTIAGAGTGLAGGRVARGGWVISLEKFDRIEIRAGEAIAGGGAILRDLHRAASAAGQLYPPDPTEIGASIGGTIATNASGSRSFRYGDTRRHVLALRVALASGEIRAFERGQAIDFDVTPIRVPRTSKHSAGFLLQPGMDWIDLFAGSEGTLGVIVEARLKLVPAAGELLAGVVFCRSDEEALDAVDSWRAVRGLRMLEYLDHGSLELLRPRYPEIPRAARAALLIEQELGHPGEIDAWEARLAEAGALIEGSWFGESDSDRERFRKFRHSLPEAVNDIARRRGLMKIGSDYGVPRESNREMLAIYRRELEREFPGEYVIFGHIGDAHVHVNILPAGKAAFGRAAETIFGFARQVVGFGGTVAAEHGLGKRKARLLEVQYTPAEIEAMRAVKRRLDPHWLLGRGTLFSE